VSGKLNIAVTCQASLLIMHRRNVLKATPYSRSAARFCGSSDAGRSSGKVMTAREVRQKKKDLQKALTEKYEAMNEEKRREFDQFREMPPLADDEGWIDIEDNEGGAMDVDEVLAGSVGIDLSHAGGEFHQLVEEHLRDSSE
jgi:hypothetical protein